MTIDPELEQEPARQRAGRIRVVDLQEYCELLISRRRLERWSSAPEGFFGLRDEQTGQAFLVRAEHQLAVG